MTRHLDARYIPPGSQRVEHKLSSAVAYLFIAKPHSSPGAMGYLGKASKPAFNCLFKTAEKREAYLRAWFARCAQASEAQAKMLAERKAARSQPHSLQVGAILVTSWGYDQTNVDFYQVTKLVGRNTVEIRKTAVRSLQTGHDTGTSMPIADHFIGKPMLKRVGPNNTVKIESYAYARPWDGKPERWSSYA